MRVTRLDPPTLIVVLIVVISWHRTETFPYPPTVSSKSMKTRLTRWGVAYSSFNARSGMSQDGLNFESVAISSNESNLTQALSDVGERKKIQRRKRKLNLTWCDRQSCRHPSTIREQIIGENNQIAFKSTATGQVVFTWDTDEAVTNEYSEARVLILVKKNDEELLKLAVKAVEELASNESIQIELTSDVADKCERYFGLDSSKFKVFDPQSISNATYDDYDQSLIQNVPGVSNPDLICTLGGDGLLMHASMLFPGPCPPILCISGGSLGFLTPFTREEMIDAIKVSLGLLQNNERKISVSNFQPSSTLKPSPNPAPEPSQEPSLREMLVSKLGTNYAVCISMRMRLHCTVVSRDGKVQARFNVLNEVVIDRGCSPYLASLECFVDRVHLTTVQADGIIFSTPTGSTAYSMAAGGSVCHPAVPAILVTPICPHVLSFRSMIFPDGVILRCYVADDARADASVAFDGKHRQDLRRGESVQIQMCKYPVPTINKIDHSADWLTSLKKNFNFNARPRQEPL